MTFFSICKKVLVEMFTEFYSRYLKVLKNAKMKNVKTFQNLGV